MTQPQPAGIDNQSVSLLLVLSLLWGGSFMFIGIAVKELPSLLIVLARVSMAAAVLLPVHVMLRGKLPGDLRSWISAGGMSFMNNVIPFTAIVWGQHHISAGMASVLNATTPLFGAAFMAMAGMEKLSGKYIAGLLLGLAGVIILRGLGRADLSGETLGILAVLLASASYGMSGLWAKKRLGSLNPLTTATCQLLISTLIMAALAFTFDEPAKLGAASLKTWVALCCLAVFSTALAYFIFFRIIARAGPSVVQLVTMIIPVTAILLSYLVLGETLSLRQLAGSLTIGAALLVIDGRIFNWFKAAK